jgi:Tol biopolymer transport system component
MSWFRGLAAFGLVFLLTGCVPEAIVWSSDGSHAVVSTVNGSYLINERGDSARIEEIRFGGIGFMLSPVAWIPGQKSFVAFNRHEFKSWDELKEDLSPEKVAAITEMGKKILERLETYEGSLENYKSGLSADRADLLAAWMYARDVDPGRLEARLQAIDPNNSLWPIIRDMKASRSSLDLFTVHGMKATRTRPVFSAREHVITFRISADAKRIALVTEKPSIPDPTVQQIANGELTHNQLVVRGLEEKSPEVVVDTIVGFWPAWSADSQSLFYFHAEAPIDRNSRGILGAMNQTRLSSAEGPLVVAETQPLVDVVFPLFSKIQVLPTGQVLFAAVEKQLPAVANQGSEENGYLYLVDPKAPAQFTRLNLRELDEKTQQAFVAGSYAVSPDGRQLAFGDDDRRSGVIDLHDGTIDWVQSTTMPSGMGFDGVCPAWRTDDEIVFCVPGKAVSEEGGKDQFVLYSRERTVILSKAWDWLPSTSDDEDEVKIIDVGETQKVE